MMPASRMSLLDGEAGFRMQFQLWGYALTERQTDLRRALREGKLAMVSEARRGDVGDRLLRDHGWWDRDEAWCWGVQCYPASGYAGHAPEWWALPAVMEWVRRTR